MASDLATMIMNKIMATSYKEVAVVLDNNYFYSRGKLVYAAVKTYKSGRTEVVFYTKNSKVLLEDNDSVIELLPNALPRIESFIGRTDILGVTVNTVIPVLEEANYLNYASIQVDTGFGLLIIKSVLFNSIEKLLRSGDRTASFRFGGRVIPKEELAVIVKLYKQEMLIGYQQIVYNQSSTRFITKFYKLNSFFSIQKAFIPVFVNYTYLYNPLLESEMKVEQTKLHKVAVEKDRLLTVNDSLSAYMLTHLEVCRALNMKHFMRFTPIFLFDVFVGLLQPDNPSFPNKTNKVMLLPSYVENRYFTAKSMSERDYKSELDSLVKNFQKVKTEDERNFVLAKTEELRKYEKQDTLMQSCSANYQKLTSIGSFALDDKENISLGKIYDYVCEASL